MLSEKLFFITLDNLVLHKNQKAIIVFKTQKEVEERIEKLKNVPHFAEFNINYNSIMLKDLKWCLRRLGLKYYVRKVFNVFHKSSGSSSISSSLARSIPIKKGPSDVLLDVGGYFFFTPLKTLIPY